LFDKNYAVASTSSAHGITIAEISRQTKTLSFQDHFHRSELIWKIGSQVSSLQNPKPLIISSFSIYHQQFPTNTLLMGHNPLFF